MFDTWFLGKVEVGKRQNTSLSTFLFLSGGTQRRSLPSFAFVHKINYKNMHATKQNINHYLKYFISYKKKNSKSH